MPIGFKRGRGPHRKGRRRKAYNTQDHTQNCICPRCGYKMLHQPGSPCFQIQCPECGSPLVRSF